MKDVNNFMGDYQAWLSQTPAGTTSNWGGGTLTKTDNGATYLGDGWESQGKQALTFNAQTNPLNLARAAPGIMNQWNTNYGEGWQDKASAEFSGKKSYTPPKTEDELFRPDLFPESGSESGLSQEVIDQLMSFVLPGLESSAKDMPANIERYVRGAKDAAESEGHQLLERNQNDVVAEMIRKGMIQSDVAGDALGHSQSEVARQVSDRAYDAEMKGAQLQMAVPQILTEIANLGKRSESYSKDEGTPYRQMISDYIRMMA